VGTSLGARKHYGRNISEAQGTGA
jgi:hypothetical protein